MTTKRYRVGIYAAAETAAAADRSVDALRAWAAEHSAWEVVGEYKDVGRVREDLGRFFTDVERGALDLVIFPSLHAFLPLGTADTIRRLALLTRLGVAFASQTEPFFSTLGRQHESLASCLLALEAQERHRVSKRLRKGHARAKRRRPMGRPRVPLKTRRAIARLREEGKTIAEIAEALDVAQSTVAKYQYRSTDDLFELLPSRAFRALADPNDD